MNEAIAAGATATITLQPVPPKTVPASSYPPGSSITGSTLTLGSIPVRIWMGAGNSQDRSSYNLRHG
jgi:hypothetical protein